MRCELFGHSTVYRNDGKTAQLTRGLLKPTGAAFQLVRVGCGEDSSEASLHHFHPGNDGRGSVGLRRAYAFLDTRLPCKSRVSMSVSRRIIALTRH